jgi:hypothetical protein
VIQPRWTGGPIFVRRDEIELFAGFGLHHMNGRRRRFVDDERPGEALGRAAVHRGPPAGDRLAENILGSRFEGFDGSGTGGSPMSITASSLHVESPSVLLHWSHDAVADETSSDLLPRRRPHASSTPPCRRVVCVAPFLNTAAAGRMLTSGTFCNVPSVFPGFRPAF